MGLRPLHVKSTTIRKLERGYPVRRNWRTINETIELLSRHHSDLNTHASALAELRRRPKDLRGSGAAIVCEVTAVNATYLTCVNLDDDSTVEVALPFELRTTPSDTPTPEIYPPYVERDEGEEIVGSYIVAVNVDGQSQVGSAPDWIDANVDARRWARAIALCNDKYALFHCSELRDIVP